jgi:hypothetical protein
VTQPQSAQKLVLKIPGFATWQPSTLQLRQAFEMAWPNPTPHVLQAFYHLAERAEAGFEDELDIAIRKKIRRRLEPVLDLIETAEFLAITARAVFDLKPVCSFCHDAPSTVVLLNRGDSNKQRFRTTVEFPDGRTATIPTEETDGDKQRFSAETACDNCTQTTDHWLAIPFQETSLNLHEGALRYREKHSICEICKAAPTATVTSQPEPGSGKIRFVAHCSTCRVTAPKQLAAR